VRDSGVGIDAALIPDLFDMFVQGERGPDRAEGGLGLGLSLVRSLTELHGGTVTAQSDGPGLGSEFAVRLPPAEPASGAEGVAPAGQLPVSKKTAPDVRVLIVDDNRDVAVSLARFLTVSGYETRIAADPPQALALAESFNPQVAILDVGLPMMDGYALGKELCARLGDSPPTLIALTGYSQDRDRQRSRDAGFALHLAKPVDAEQLLEALRQASSQRRTPVA